ncbi:MAG: tRNA lysidine(34) synthetase TilS [Brevundimonas sp.]
MADGASPPEGLSEDEVFGRLDARLMQGAAKPAALALSGGGDSIALMRLASAWARRRERRLVALTVDHGLHPESGAWTRRAGEAARSLGLEWRALAWRGAKPTTGLAAAARRARHTLIAEAARGLGARVVLTGHTLDDVLEGHIMREEGVSLGRLSEWSPSPVWPEGRGLMLLRPLIGARRAALRRWLKAQGADWLDDPANDDPRHPRVRARLALAGRAVVLPKLAAEAVAETARGLPGGGLALPRGASVRALGLAAMCAGGGDAPPRRGRLEALAALLAAGGPVRATLSGARIEADADQVVIAREPGEWARRNPPDLRPKPGDVAIWDGRFEIGVDGPGWTVAPARGRMSALSPEDRAELMRRPAMLRSISPIMIPDDGRGPRLAERVASVRSLVLERYRLAAGETPHERALIGADDGAGAETDLCLFGDGAGASSLAFRGV